MSDHTMKQTPPNTGKMDMQEEKKNMQEEKNDDRAEERVEATLEESPPTSNDVITDPLIHGLVEDVVLGQVLTRLPWCNLPLLMTLNQTWADALAHRFPSYASVYRPILSNSLVIYRIPSRKYSNSYLGLWVYNYHRFLWRLPIPAIPENLHGRVEFVLDDNYDRIFSFTRIRAEYDRTIYNVSMLDLSEGTMCSWKNLPSLQYRVSKYPIEAAKYPYSCSSFRTENGIGIKLIFRSWGRYIDQGSFSVWTLDGRKTCEWHQWQCQPVTQPLIQSFNNAEKNTPFYVEIEVNIPLRGHIKSVKYLYQRCEQWRYTTEARYSWHRTPQYIFMFKNDERRPEQPIMDFNIYHIKVKESYSSSQVSFHKAKLNDESKRVLHVSEWNGFEQFWRPLASRYHPWKAPDFRDWENNGRSVMKILSNGCSGRKGIDGIRWDKKKFKIGRGAHRTDEEKESINIRLAQKGHSLYIYSFVAKSGLA